MPRDVPGVSETTTFYLCVKESWGVSNSATMGLSTYMLTHYSDVAEDKVILSATARHAARKSR